MRQPRKSPKKSVDVGSLIGGEKGNLLDEAVQAAVRDALEMNELLDKQRERRESEARARAASPKR
jgi:hypothetical protein